MGGVFLDIFQDLFHFREESPGSVFWHEKGWLLFQRLVEYMRAKQRLAGYKEINTPFDKLAELYGATGYCAENLADVPAAIEAALACGKPAVVDVAVDPNALFSFRRDSFKHRGG